MSDTTTSPNKIPGQKIRVLGDDDIDINVNAEDNLDDEDDDDADVSIATEDDDDNVELEDTDADEDIDDDDSNHGIDSSTLEQVSETTTRIGSKYGRVTGMQAMDVPVPRHILDAANAADDNESDDDIASMSGNVTGDDEYDDDDDDEDPETYLQKFDAEMNKDLLLEHHPTQFTKNDAEISVLCQVTRNESNNIIDPLHKTTPFLTKYEKTRVLGQRAKQLNSGSKPYVVVPDHILDGYIIAQMELAQKRIPFIVERPIHGGGCEYWRVRDLEVL